MAAVTPHRAAVVDGLVDSDTFFERAARGERDGQAATAAPDRALGAAMLPRATPPDHPRPIEREGEARARRTLPRPAAKTVAVVAVPAVAVVGGAIMLAGSFGGQGRPTTPTVVERPPARSASPADVLAPRAARIAASGDGHLAGVAYDPGSGVRSVELVVDGRRREIRQAVCRPACSPALRFSFAASSPDRMEAVAIVVADAAGNRTIAWQTLTVPARRPSEVKLTARLEQSAAPRADHAVGGRLTAADGKPIRHGRVELVGAARTHDAVARVVGTATTDAAGRWRVAHLHSSHVYRARHIADGDTPAVSAPVRATVRARLALRVHRRGAATVISGRVQPIAPARLLLASREAGGWRSERTGRADADGRFRLRVPARMRGRVAVFVAPSPDLPYAPAGRVVDLARP